MIIIPDSLTKIIKPHMFENLVFFDTETTGIHFSTAPNDLSADTDSILEVAFIRTKNLEIVEKLHLYIAFDGKIPPESSRVHNISDNVMNRMKRNARKYEDILEGSPSLEDIKRISDATNSLETAPAIPWRKAANAILSFTSHARNNQATLCAHNISFDTRWINYMMERAIRRAYEGKGKNEDFLRKIIAREAIQLRRKNYIVDTLSCSRKVWPNGESHTLNAVADRLTIDRSARSEYHGAMVDTILLLDAFRGMLGMPPHDQKEDISEELF